MRAGSVALLAAALLVAGACRRQAPPDPGGELVTEEVGPPPDALVRPEDDPVERRRAADGVAGVLPSGFPEGLPLPASGSLTDYGQGDGGQWVEVTVPAAATAVGPAYGRQLRAAGWQEATPGAWSREGRQVRVNVEPLGPSSRVRIAY